MISSEVVSIVSIVCSVLSAITIAIVPAVLNYRLNKPKQLSYEEQDKLLFKEYRLKYLALHDELSTQLSAFITRDTYETQALVIGTIYKLRLLSNKQLTESLDKLLAEVQKSNLIKEAAHAAFIEFTKAITIEHLNAFWYGSELGKGNRDLYN